MIPLPLAIIAAAIILAGGVVFSAWLIARKLNARASPRIRSFPLPFNLPPLPAEALPVEPSGIPISLETRLQIGTAVLANWNEIWWRAKVVGLEGSGRVRIHYIGWDSAWDETVSRENLQVDIHDSVNDDN